MLKRILYYFKYCAQKPKEMASYCSCFHYQISSHINAITQHNDNETYSKDSFVELLKDIDSSDRYLHGIKTKRVYLERSNRILKKLGIKA